MRASRARKAQIEEATLSAALSTHLVDADALRSDDFDAYFVTRREVLVGLIEKSMGKPVQPDLAVDTPEELLVEFDTEDETVAADVED